VEYFFWILAALIFYVYFVYPFLFLPGQFGGVGGSGKVCDGEEGREVGAGEGIVERK